MFDCLCEMVSIHFVCAHICVCACVSLSSVTFRRTSTIAQVSRQAIAGEIDCMLNNKKKINIRIVLAFFGGV